MTSLPEVPRKSVRAAASVLEGKKKKRDNKSKVIFVCFMFCIVTDGRYFCTGRIIDV